VTLRFLTDDGRTWTENSLFNPLLVVDYTQNTSGASGVILDIDYLESFEIIAYFNKLVGGIGTETITINSGDPGTGNGMATVWSFDHGSNEDI